MGNLSSTCTNQAEVFDLTLAHGGMDPSQCIDGKPSKTVDSVLMPRWSGSDARFHIHDLNNAIQYVAHGRKPAPNPFKDARINLECARIITDVDGNKSAVIQRKIILRSADWSFPFFLIFTYKPNSSGQESTEKDRDGVPIFLFALVRAADKSYFGGIAESPNMGVLEYCLYNGNEEGPCVLRSLKQKLTPTNFTVVKPEDEQVVAAIRKTAHSERNVTVEVAAGMDLLGVVCFAIAANDDLLRRARGCLW